MPFAAPPTFMARSPWWGGDLQTIRNVVVRPRIDLARWSAREFSVDAPDGGGDQFLGVWHEPSPGFGNQSRRQCIVILVHGLTGCADSAYMLRTTHAVLSAGHSVLRMNLRGAGASRSTCRGQYNAGVSDDLAAVIAAVRAMPGAETTSLVAVAYSLGANVMLKYLGEQGAQSRLDAAIAISPPADLRRTSRFFGRPRNWLYQSWLLDRMKTECVAQIASVTDHERAVIRSVRSVWEFDDRFLAPHCDYSGAADYYARCSSGPLLGAIKTPTTIIHSDNDPWIPADVFEGTDAKANPDVTLMITRGGGHVGFHGRGDALPWHDQYVLRLLDVAQ